MLLNRPVIRALSPPKLQTYLQPNNDNFFSALAEIISIKDIKGVMQFYVHYVDCEY